MSDSTRSPEHLARLHALLDVVECWAGLERSPRDATPFADDPATTDAPSFDRAPATASEPGKSGESSFERVGLASPALASRLSASSAAPVELAFRGKLPLRARPSPPAASSHAAPPSSAAHAKAPASTRSGEVAATPHERLSHVDGESQVVSPASERSPSSDAVYPGPLRADRRTPPSTSAHAARPRSTSAPSAASRPQPSLLAPLEWSDRTTSAASSQLAPHAPLCSQSPAAPEPFDDFEERLADALERSALEAGIELS